MTVVPTVIVIEAFLQSQVLGFADEDGRVIASSSSLTADAQMAEFCTAAIHTNHNLLKALLSSS